MKHLPLFYYPSTWVWVDDDKLLLNTMTSSFNSMNNIRPFNSANECLKFMNDYQAPSAKHHFLKTNSDDETYGISQNTPMNFDVQAIVSLRDDPTRHAEVTCFVLDYNMPEMTGFELAEQLAGMIPKILLTGNTEENTAIQGFNDNLINRFVQKAEPTMAGKLKKYLKELTTQYFCRLTAPLLSYLEADGKSPLSDPTFIDFFETFCSENNLKEFYLIDKQGSFLCTDVNGISTCLVVHTKYSINDWLAIYGEENDLDKADLVLIKEHKKIPFFGVKKEAWQVNASDWNNYFYNASKLNGREEYYLSIVKIAHNE